MEAAPIIYNRVGLRIDLEPGKTENILPYGCDPVTFLHQFYLEEGLPQIVSDFTGCLDVPRHAKTRPGVC